MKPWKRIDPTTITKVGWRDIVSKTFIDGQGRRQVYETLGVEGSTTAAVIALTPDNRVVIARQFRPGPEIIMDELPGGIANVGEDPLAAAHRELLEETGYRAERLEEVGIARRTATDNTLGYYYIGYNCTPSSDQTLDEEEEIEVTLISISQLIDNAKYGKMTDASAVLMAYDKLMKIQENA